MNIVVLDIVAAVILLVGALRVMLKGFVKEFMSKAGLILGFAAALLFSSQLAPLIEERFKLGNLSNVAAFAAIFLGVFLLTIMAASTVRTVLEGLNLTFLDGFLGFLLGLVEGAVLISFLVYLLRLQTLIDIEPFLAGSIAVGILEPIAPIGIEFFEESF